MLPRYDYAAFADIIDAMLFMLMMLRFADAAPLSAAAFR